MNTIKCRQIYFAIAVIFLVSVALVLWLPSGTFIQSISAVPLVASLVAALFQILRDQSAYDRQILLQESQNRFALGATSHMANVAFDKHVQFCEEYVEEANKTLRTLFQNGPCEEMLNHASVLYSLQQKYAVWLTPRIEDNLEIFEAALRKLGANAGYLNKTVNPEDRQQRNAEMYKTLADLLGSKIMGPEWQGEKLNDELAITMTIRRLRGLLGTEDLTSIRTALLEKAG